MSAVELDLDAVRSMIVHQCPPEGGGVMPCCGRTPFEVDPRERMTATELVTCPTVPALLAEVERLREYVAVLEREVATPSAAIVQQAVERRTAQRDEARAALAGMVPAEKVRELCDQADADPRTLMRHQGTDAFQSYVRVDHLRALLPEATS